MYNKYPSGSEWNKWDLHIHTPYSLVAEYGGDNNAVWDNFIAHLERMPQDIKVIGINDYLFLDGYEKVLEYKGAGRLKNIDLILPVIEFRLKEFVGNAGLGRINYHVIFADASLLSINQIKSQFLSGLSAKANLVENHIENYHSWSGVINKESLMDFGVHIYEHTPQDKRTTRNFLEIGFNNINFELSDIEYLLGEKGQPNKFLKDKYFKAIGKVEWDEFRWDGSPAEKKTIINRAHFVFSASPTAEQAQNNRDALKRQNVNSRLLHCSDAHAFPDDISNTKPKDIGHCFTWIKANTTFEGLRQTLYEPDERINIQILMPDKKNDRHVISEIRFIDNNNLFGDQKILLNRNLNAIIGGKSSGKSLLLYSMAKSIDAEQVDRTSKRLNFEGYKFESDYDFEVVWRSGDIDSYMNSEGKENEHAITYIPQLYINHLVEKNNKEELNLLIKNILLQDDAFALFYQGKIGEISEVNASIDGLTNKYLDIRQSIIDSQVKSKELGASASILKSIANIQKDIVDAQKKSSISSEEMSAHSYLEDAKINAVSDIAKVDSTQQCLLEIRNILNGLSVDLFGPEGDAEYDVFHNKGKLEEVLGLHNADEKEIRKIIDQLKVDYKSMIDNFKSEIDKLKLGGKRKRIVDDLNKINIRLEPIQDKFKSQKELLALNHQLETEKQKLIQSEGLEKKINGLMKEYDEIRVKTVALLRRRHSLYKEIQDFVNTKKSEIGSEITLSCQLKYGKSQLALFNQVNRNLLNRDNIFNSIIPDENVNYEELLRFCEKRLWVSNEKLYNDKNTFIPLKARILIGDVLRGIYSDGFVFDYSVAYNGDDLLEMSPGKKGTVLLILFLQISSSEHPILIDQPEDNLDNRTIYDLLCKMIRQKKKDRQIIIVSHNANLVVATDSENIIVANQEGKGVELNDGRYRFEYVNGALENSYTKKENKNILYSQGIREHVCDILEGGGEAFKQRKRKYSIK